MSHSLSNNHAYLWNLRLTLFLRYTLLGILDLSNIQPLIDSSIPMMMGLPCHTPASTTDMLACPMLAAAFDDDGYTRIVTGETQKCGETQDTWTKLTNSKRVWFRSARVLALRFVILRCLQDRSAAGFGTSTKHALFRAANCWNLMRMRLHSYTPTSANEWSATTHVTCPYGQLTCHDLHMRICIHAFCILGPK